MNKAQIDYICVILQDVYITGTVDGEIKSHDFLKWAEGYAKILDRLSIAEEKGDE